MKLVLLSALATLAIASPLLAGDLRRAKTKVPRQPWRAADSGAGMNELLNKHLRGRFAKAEACESWSSAQLQQFLSTLHPHLSPELEKIYGATKDRRSASPRPSMPLHEHMNQWKFYEAAAKSAGGVAHDVLRDALCIEASLWLVHHTPSTALDALPESVPLLPKAPRVQSELPATEDGQKVWKKYQETHFCTICHGSGTPFLPPGSDPAAPKWPPPVAPSMPFQFNSDMTGWMKDQFIQPGGANMTSGQWHYDFINNRLRLDYVAHPSSFPAKLWPLNAHIRSLWLADPIPQSEEGKPPSDIYGPGAERGYVYMFIKPQPFLPWICSKANKKGLSILHPDTLSWGSNFQGQYDSHVPVNVSFVGREWVEELKEWGDHYFLDYHDVANPNCTGPFELWKSIIDNRPLKDGGVVDCGRGNGRARTFWHNLKAEAPDPKLFYEANPFENHDFAKCKTDPTLGHLQRRLFQEWSQSSDADVRLHAAEAASVVRASLHLSLGHSMQPRELLDTEHVVMGVEPNSFAIV